MCGVAKTMKALRLVLFASVLCMCAGIGLCQNGAFYRVVRRDFRKCGPYPVCGGYFVQKVNDGTEIYVGLIRTDGLSKEVLQYLTPEAANDYKTAVFKARLVRNRDFKRIFDLKVVTAYLGYPGPETTTTLINGTLFYGLTTTRAKATTITTAQALNTKLSIVITNATFSPLRRPLLAENVQVDQFRFKGALIIASIKSRRITVSQVFFKLPVVGNPCALFKIKCDAPDLVVYSRTGGFCFIPTCLKAKDILFCTLAIPSCSTGYKLAGWPALPGGCTAYVCDPVFFPNATQLGFI